tara:strand:+ start:146 stop:613 length:468 start_codon:yes stop_codon:yes gene_type:complete
MFGDALLRSRAIWQIEACGGIRRFDEDVTTLDLVAVPLQMAAVEHELGNLDLEEEWDVWTGEWAGMPLRLMFAEEQAFGAAVMFRTGPSSFIRMMATKAEAMGFVFDETGLWLDKLRAGGSTEYEIFDALGMKYVEPDERGQQETSRPWWKTLIG